MEAAAAAALPGRTTGSEAWRQQRGEGGGGIGTAAAAAGEAAAGAWVKLSVGGEAR
jgi:hypothetical protein